MNKDIKKSVFAIFLPIIIIAFSFVGASFAFAQEGPGNSDFGLSNKPVCPGPQNEGAVRCHARVIVENNAGPAKKTSGPSPKNLTPVKLHTAYTSQTTAPGMPIIAVVAAYHNPYILNELNIYSQQFGIPTLPACVGSVVSSTVPCFKQIDQNGGTNFPQPNPQWGLELSLDVEIAHAMCQNCKILLVEASDNGINALMPAIDQAVLQGANAISASWGLGEFVNQTSYDFHLNHPGVAIIFSSGDYGYGVQYPASSNFVTAVGGTKLTFSGNGNYSGETAWSGSSSGCSAYEAKPTWQTDTLCANRTVADVSAAADPGTNTNPIGAAVYNGNSWYTIGGTSLSAPIIAGVQALAGVPTGNTTSSIYANFTLANVHDIITGSNGSCGNYLCTAVAGYDGPTGLGTPKGLGAF